MNRIQKKASILLPLVVFALAYFVDGAFTAELRNRIPGEHQIALEFVGFSEDGQIMMPKTPENGTSLLSSDLAKPDHNKIADQPTDQPAEQLAKQPAEQSTEQPTEQPVDQPVEQPVEQPGESGIISTQSEEENANLEETEQDPDELFIRKTINIQGIDYTFCWCPAGTFIMGSPEGEIGRDNSETQHHVILTKGFWLLESEVTQAMWENVMKTTAEEQRKKGSNQTGNAAGMGANYPMYYINWADCHDFCQKLSSLTDEGEYRLPTEAEWEYACRAGTTTPFSPDRPLNQEVNNNDDQAVVEDGEQPAGQLREVKSSQPNAWGLYDMHGNVREWCSDWYADYPTGCITDPTGPKRGACRVNRGGSWESPDSVCRSASRSKELPMFRYSNLGFRILLVPTE